ncbi:hypothetical protein GCM10010400_70080 [Streptomyces aculeolatus]|uniref:hypothetical protein n=1 Tax=Streptomyces aculeolatus TaxID=270689 RepID=UPI001CEDBED9|nr:hypothetical protein [Streptomyces aculeolatus]
MPEPTDEAREAARTRAQSQPRDGNNRFVRTPERARRDARAAELRGQGKTFRQIADELYNGNRPEAYRGVQHAFADIAREPVESLAKSLLAQLEELTLAALEILERDHLAYSHGEVVIGPDGTPVLDDGPKLAAIREARQLNESIRKLTGTDAEKKINVSGGVRYEIVGVDPEALK